MLLPKRTKHRKGMRGRMKGVANRNNKIQNGVIALQSLDPGWITNRQIEAARKTLARLVRREGSLVIRVFPDKVVTKKPAETRQGGGKGNPEYWVAVVHPGTILFEMDVKNIEEARVALGNAARKLPINTRIIYAEQ